MTRPVSMTPQGPQALRGDQTEKQFLQSRGQRLKVRVRGDPPSTSRGARFSGGQGTRGAQGVKGHTPKGKRDRGGWMRKGWKQGEEMESRRG